jgi:universal stress protein A
MSVYKHILIATDLSDENSPVVAKAVKIAKAFEAKVSLVHVVEPLPGYGYAYVGVADIEGQLIEEAKQAILKMAKKHHIPEDQCHVEVGPTELEIFDIVGQEKVDCIVLGSHGRHGLAELLGSTAHAVVHGAPCDVVTLKIETSE